jgi:hypothetical protein
MKNKLISIGYTGLMKCYLNIPEQEAINRYLTSENISQDQYDADPQIQFHVFEFEDEFGSYSVWK